MFLHLMHSFRSKSNVLKRIKGKIVSEQFLLFLNRSQGVEKETVVNFSHVSVMCCLNSSPNIFCVNIWQIILNRSRVTLVQ